MLCLEMVSLQRCSANRLSNRTLIAVNAAMDWKSYAEKSVKSRILISLMINELSTFLSISSSSSSSSWLLFEFAPRCLLMSQQYR